MPGLQDCVASAAGQRRQRGEGCAGAGAGEARATSRHRWQCANCRASSCGAQQRRMRFVRCHGFPARRSGDRSIAARPRPVDSVSSAKEGEELVKTSLVFPLVISTSLALPATALADQADAGQAFDEDFKKAGNDLDKALSTSDCTTACQALGSMRRAAEKLCAITPGPRCDAANARADEAAKRVRDACPDCAIAFRPSPDMKPPATRTVEERDVTRASPKAESGRGGCASCEVTGSSATLDPSWIALILWGLTRRRRKTHRPQ
jgi:hypothetical protein